MGKGLLKVQAERESTAATERNHAPRDRHIVRYSGVAKTFQKNAGKTAQSRIRSLVVPLDMRCKRRVGLSTAEWLRLCPTLAVPHLLRIVASVTLACDAVALLL